MGHKILPFISFGIFLFIAILLTNIWFGDGRVIVGHDSGFSLNAKEDLERKFFTWWDDRSFGVDGSMFIGSWFIHSVDVLTALLAGVDGGGNQYTVLFWLGAVFLSALILSVYLARRLMLPQLVLLLPFFYVFNFYVFQSVFIFERTKYSLLVALPIFLLLSFKVREKSLPIVFASMLMGVTLFIFNGGGWAGLPLYGGILVAALVLICYALLEAVLTKRFETLFRTITFFILSFFLTILLDAYSILPMLEANVFSTNTVRTTLETISNRGWVDAVSVSTSFLNLFRMQGSSDWYTSAVVINSTHPYASLYLKNPLLIFASFLIPIFAFMAIILAKDILRKQYVFLFSLLVLISMFFAAGSHPPTGVLYMFLFEHVPLFSIFRSPYFKFASLLVLSMSFLLSVSLSILFENFFPRFKIKQHKNMLLVGFSLVILLGWFLYHFVFFRPTIFAWQKGFSTLVSVPQYVYEVRNWIAQNVADNERILLVPPLLNSWKADMYTWGYWSLAPLPQLLTDKPIVSDDSLLVNEENILVSQLYKAMREGNENTTINLSFMLGIKYLILRNDVVVDPMLQKANGTPKPYKDMLAKMTRVKQVTQFGEWDVYKIEGHLRPMLFTANSLSTTDNIDDYFDIGSNIDRPFFLRTEEKEKGEGDFVNQFFARHIQRPSCVSCIFEEGVSIEEPKPAILPGSPFYPIKVQGENFLFQRREQKIDALLGFMLKRYSEVRLSLELKRQDGDVINALKRMDEHITAIQKHLNEEDALFKDNHLLKRINTHLLFIGNGLQLLLINQQSTQRQEVQKQMIETYTKITDFQQYLSPTVKTDDYWQKTKLYTFSVAKSGKYTLYLDPLSFPRDLDKAKPILPITMVLQTEDGTYRKDFSLSKTENTIVSFPVDLEQGVEYVFTLAFPDGPNRLNPQKTSITFPEGVRQCEGGEILSVDNERSYKVSFRRDVESQRLSLFMSESASNTRYFSPQISLDLSERVSSESEREFAAIYRSLGIGEEITLYICSFVFEPQISNFSVKEVVKSPRVFLASEESSVAAQNAPTRFVKNNPTRYEVSIDAAEQPFVLIFNQRFHPAWKLYENGKTISSHVTINGFANGWVLDKSNQPYKLTLIYEPQNRLYQGLLITGISMIFIFGSCVGFIIKRRKIQ